MLKSPKIRYLSHCDPHRGKGKEKERIKLKDNSRIILRII
nr:MAG TPA: hypothetical protein [Caudoviricetes sp.]